MVPAGDERKNSGGLHLAAVQFVFTLGWTTYALMLPALLEQAGIAATWLPVVLMIDQVIFAVMDILFGAMADRMSALFQRFARLILALTTVSALAFMLLPLAAEVSAGVLGLLLLIWVVSASVVRAPTLVLLAKRARAAQRPALVIWYSAGIGLAMALSPFLGLGLRGLDPVLPFSISALSLLLAVWVLLRAMGTESPAEETDAPQPAPFAACVPLLIALGVAGFGFQMHAFVNAAPLYLAHAAKESLPWLMPLLWVGFFAALLGVGKLVARFAAMPVAAGGMVLVAVGSYLAPHAGSLGGLVALQVFCGAGWALAFAGLMEQASAAGSRGAEGKVMGSFFAITALASFARIAFVSHALPAGQGSQFILPAVLLLLAGAIATVDAKKWSKIKMPQSR